MSAKKSNERLLHAQHNEEVCLFLNTKPYLDWVVTTAFYAANHFVRYGVFPYSEILRGKKVTYSGLDEYCILNGKKATHGVTCDLVATRLKEVRKQYLWLLSASKTARYSDYQTSQAIADKAIEYLEIIKKSCGAGTVAVPTPSPAPVSELAPQPIGPTKSA